MTYTKVKDPKEVEKKTFIKKTNLLIYLMKYRKKMLLVFQASKDNASTGYVDYTTINSLECGLF